MTQDENSLDRVEAALERQVTVNADLRTSVEVLRSSVETLVQVANQHRECFTLIVAELRDMQSLIRGMQTENRRILSLIETKKVNEE